jgi:DNA uptake protein ComE-like DNA-binding protein
MRTEGHIRETSMQIGDLSRARTPVETGGSLPLWARFVILVACAILAGWLVAPSPGLNDPADETLVAASEPTGAFQPVSPPEPALPVQVATAEPSEAYVAPAPSAPVALPVAEAEPAVSPTVTGSSPGAVARVPVSPRAPMPVEATPARLAAVADPPTAPAVAAGRAGGLVDLNAAPVDALNDLRGGGRIGRAIVRGRPYGSVDDLVKKRIVSRSVYARIKDQVTVR